MTAVRHALVPAAGSPGAAPPPAPAGHIPATTYWDALNAVSALDPTIDVRRDERCVGDGDVITSAGVSAGIDMAAM